MKDLKPTIRMVYEAHGKLPSVEWLVKTAKVTPEEATRAIGEYNVEEAPFQQAKEVFPRNRPPFRTTYP